MNLVKDFASRKEIFVLLNKSKDLSANFVL
jgi:hypothetical protein